MSLPRVSDSNAVKGWAWLYKAAYGSNAPLKFSGITYGGKTPTTPDGLTPQLLIKAARTDADGSAIVNTSVMDTTSDPLTLGYVLDTTISGLAAGGTYYGELWVTDEDAAYGRQLVNEFQLVLVDPIKDTFA